MGLHTIDTVRRDAAEQRIAFDTKHTPGSQYATVELVRGDITITYNIDLEKDIVDEITFSSDQGDIGNLKFEYLESVEDVGNEFVTPTRPRQQKITGNISSGLWLEQLLEDSLK